MVIHLLVMQIKDESLADEVAYMNSKSWSLPLFLVALAFLGSPISAESQTQTRHYMLLSDSYLLDDCPICGRPSIMLPLRGSFDLVPTESSNSFRVTNIDFTTVNYSVKGEGTLTLYTEKKSQEATFNLQVKEGDEPVENLVFTNEVKEITRGFPMLDFIIKETPSTLIRVYSFRIAAAPLKDLWFSTTDNFVDRSIAGTKVERSGGDILSINGTLVRSWGSLVKDFNLLQPDNRVGIDVFGTNLAGQTLVSLFEDLQSSAGTLSQGDLLNPDGSVAVANSNLISSFQFTLPAEPGLDAYFVVPDGTILFSIKSDQYSAALNQNITSGDLLSTSGTIFKSGGEIKSKFIPSFLEQDYGLDALFIWPSGEIWFSTEEDFHSQVVGQIYSGDLLSDAGYIVFRNRELLQSFRVEGEILNYGLDGIMVFADLTNRVEVQAPVLSITKVDSVITIQWEGESREYRLERATTVNGPYLPVNEWSPTTSWTGAAEGTSAFFRVTAR